MFSFFSSRFLFLSFFHSLSIFLVAPSLILSYTCYFSSPLSLSFSSCLSLFLSPSLSLSLSLCPPLSLARALSFSLSHYCAWLITNKVHSASLLQSPGRFHSLPVERKKRPFVTEKPDKWYKKKLMRILTHVSFFWHLFFNVLFNKMQSNFFYFISSFFFFFCLTAKILFACVHLCCSLFLLRFHRLPFSFSAFIFFF